MQKQKLQQQQVAAAVAAAQGQQGAGTQQAAQVQPAQATQASPQLAAVTAPRPGTVLAGPPVNTLQVARLTRVPTQGQIQAQAAQTAQVTLTKPPVVSVPAVVSSAGVTTLPVTVAGISVAIGQPQKPGAPVLTQSFPQMQVQQLIQMKKQQQAAAAAQQKAGQPQQGQTTVQQKIGTQQVTGAGSTASPAAEGDLRCHHPTPTRNQTTVLHLHNPGPKTHRSPADPGGKASTNSAAAASCG
ncbi:E1A-binding protein p400 [Oryzias melastigma]|uniref:E1A-binding protein p400 n=1 Tax=Oryzias melastigma TaxID=30732 RepID=A0A834CIE4_ORYME|nr:E1A-binding protein p400 [Oryzias melastigma]